MQTQKFAGLTREHVPDWPGLIDNILRKGTPNRVYHMELFQDGEISNAITERFGLAEGLDPADPDFEKNRYVAVQRFCGFDYVRIGLDGFGVPLFNSTVEDTAELPRAAGRHYRDEHIGPIANWQDFEAFKWPDPNASGITGTLEWYQENLPDDMCIVSGSMSHFCEWLTWLMGYETFCYALFDQRDLVQAMSDKILELYEKAITRYLEFDRVKLIFASDDMGYKTGLLFSAEDMIEFVLKPHKRIAELTHKAGLPYLLHSCGNLSDITDYLTDEILIDGKHSFEDTIEDVREVKHTYGKKTALIGGIDVDFLCRASEQDIRKRVTETLDICMPGGGYCLGSGNSVANYIPLDNYLAMLDEGWLYGR